MISTGQFLTTTQPCSNYKDRVFLSSERNLNKICNQKHSFNFKMNSNIASGSKNQHKHVFKLPKISAPLINKTCIPNLIFFLFDFPCQENLISYV